VTSFCTVAYPMYQETVALASTADPRACLSLLIGLFGSTARIEQLDETTLEVTSGSRVAYRLFGAFLGANVPVKLRFHLRPEDGGTRVELAMRSDAGWYLSGTTLAEQAYQRRFAEIVTRLQQRHFTIVS